jgi:hypothetical protein
MLSITRVLHVRPTDRSSNITNTAITFIAFLLLYDSSFSLRWFVSMRNCILVINILSRVSYSSQYGLQCKRTGIFWSFNRSGCRIYISIHSYRSYNSYFILILLSCLIYYWLITTRTFHASFSHSMTQPRTVYRSASTYSDVNHV